MIVDPSASASTSPLVPGAMAMPGAAALLSGAIESAATRRSRLGLAALMVGAGVLHFVIPKFYEELIPGWLGNRRAWVYGSGVAELICGAMLVVPRTRRLGAWATLALLVLVFPGNIKMALDAGAPHDAESWGAWLRLPVQIPLWRWAHKHTRP